MIYGSDTLTFKFPSGVIDNVAVQLCVKARIACGKDCELDGDDTIWIRQQVMNTEAEEVIKEHGGIAVVKA